ncbi:MAG: hypothetical protein R3C41_07195 [Calditrichia bacterium]|nr:hypothetical protein [Calditrichota bacterium]MCB0266865.1 hypothetical protein [Calditrichota bacterium]MCB9066765.1 hypothetical protein [Calditrichia bacterium]
MLRKSTLVFFALLVSVSFAIAQDGDWGIKFSGFVKSDHFFDTRQTVAAREGHFLLYPAAESMDEDGDDMNATPNFNQLAIQTRLTGKITAPDAFGAKVSGVLEGAFFGHSDPDINGFRLRHAFMKMVWDNTTIIAGQYWHPLFVTAVFPGTVSFNTGVPFQPFSRNPQLRLEQKFGTAVLTLAASSQRDFASPGGSTPLRNAALPNLSAQIQLNPGKNVIGATVDFKQLRPSLADDGKVTGVSLQAFGKADLGSAAVELEATLGQNLFDHLMLGGFTVAAEGSEPGKTEYTTMNVLSLWGEVYATSGNVQPGIFFGYSQNQGASDDVAAVTPSARGFNIKDLLRVSPRVVIKSGKAQIAGEVEFTKAGYVDTSVEDAFDDKGKPGNSDLSTSNIRLLLSFILGF